jgi:hypothetical protein
MSELQLPLIAQGPWAELDSDLHSMTIWDQRGEVARVYGSTAEKAEKLGNEFVHAVNSHAALGEALRLLRDYSRECSCQCGGWDGDGLASQPCDRCDKASTILTAADPK